MTKPSNDEYIMVPLYIPSVIVGIKVIALQRVNA